MKYGLNYGLKFGVIQEVHALLYVPRVTQSFKTMADREQQAILSDDDSVIVISSDVTSPEKVFTPTKR